MKRTGVAKLPLHYGKAPRWLVLRMQKLAKEMVTVIIEEYSQDEFLRRISDPFWFQALGCVLGYDWHSSGVTTVLTGVLKNAINPTEQGLAVCGGKGKTSLQAPVEISRLGEKFGFSTDKVDRLRYASRMSAKVDNTAIQAGYPLYHHAFFVTERGKWAVVQQGMSAKDRTARRYHWIKEGLCKDSFVVEPHEAIVGEIRREVVLDLTAKGSEECRETSVDLSKEKPRKVKRLLESVRPVWQKSLLEWVPGAVDEDYTVDVLSMPRRVNWNALREAYEFQPKNYEELLSIKGVGPATVRGLALVSQIIYGKPASWKDPVRYSFAYGGKDGVPYPVNRKAMDETIHILEQAIQEARLGNKDKIRSLERLRQFVPDNIAL
ncbi:MAG: DUF763 domain-containing protein [Candidatus Bathyarchaeota archaeon]|nr:DUF763 domain-containing protein [Candidatus Bathyarchaeota archaeon]MDH5636405.1 DUF763 domain-containing protein [Candidatus Bathyarchaeota archaeon]